PRRRRRLCGALGQRLAQCGLGAGCVPGRSSIHRRRGAVLMDTTVVTVGEPLTISDVVRVARDGVTAVLGGDARVRMQHSRDYIERLVAEGRTVYGVTTGFGKLASERIAPADVRQLQRNLILSHAMGVGEALPIEAE